MRKVEFSKEDILACLRYMNAEQEIKHHFRFTINDNGRVILDGIDFYLKNEEVNPQITEIK